MRNNKGFSVVEGLLILIIVGILGFTGWYVYDARNKTTDSLVNADAANSSVRPQESTFKAKAPKYTFTAPSGWKTTESYPDNHTGSIVVKSPDYSVKHTGLSECASYTGTSFGIYISDRFVDSKLVSKMLAPNYSNLLQKDIKAATLGGQPAVEYMSTPGECGWSLITKTIYKVYNIEIGSLVGGDNDSLSPAVQAEYDNFVASFKFL